MSAITLGDAAAKLGLRVFPCNQDRRPVNAHGFKEASSDPEEIKREFARPGATTIGMATGHVSGLVAIDIDVKHPDANGNDWLDEHYYDLPPTRKHHTQSGGLHLIFKAPPGVEIRNSQGGKSGIAPGVDVRGDGGYIIIPPSPGYSVADDIEPAEMPDWLIETCQKKRRDPPKSEAPRDYRAPQNGDASKYAESALRGECAAVANAPEGTRNGTLNVAAVKLGSLVAVGLLSKQTVIIELTRAATYAGLDQREIEATIRSGLTYGMSQPREIPEREPGGHNGTNGTYHRDKAGHQGPEDDVLPFPLLWFDEIHPVMEANDFVQGVLVQKSAVVVYGNSNAGKTFWTTDLVLHVAAGLTWSEKRVDQGGVIYCALEGGNGFKNRVAAWRKKHGLEGEKIPFAAIQSSINLLDPQADTQRLIRTIQDAAGQMGCPVVTVVIDTLSRAMAGGKRTPDDMGALVMNMDTIRAATGACVIFIHHSGKDQARGARGHSLLRAAIDTEIEVVVNEETGARAATLVKQRELSKGAIYGFTLDIVELGENQHGEPVTTCVVEHTGAQASRPAKEAKLAPQQQWAMAALIDALAGAGRSGHYGCPANVPTVPEELWRDTFYKSSMPGSSQETKKRAFHRASTALLTNRKVAMRDSRVWVVSKDLEPNVERDIEAGH
jgi:hypothetical protein